MVLVSDMDDLALWFALYRLETSYWWDVDCNGGCKAHEFYTSTGLFAVGDNHFNGRENIRAFYTWRQRRGSLTTRHLINNLQVSGAGERDARLTAVLSVYRGNGRPPIRGTKPPCLIADIEADCVQGADEAWRFQAHSVIPVFVGSDIPLSLSIDTQILADSERGLLRETT